MLVDQEMTLLLHGKGRKERTVPSWAGTAAILRAYLREIDRNADSPVFPNRAGRRVSRSGVEDRLGLAVEAATEKRPSLVGRRVSPHTIRHSTAMRLRQTGMDVTVIALWLGHARPLTTHHYVEVDLEMKEAALRRVADPSPKQPTELRASDRLLGFLRGL